MKATTKILLCFVAVLLIGSATTLGARVAAPLNTFANAESKSQASEHGGKIESKYDGFNHETIITLNKMRVTCGDKKGNLKDVCVNLVAALHCPGIQLDYVRYASLQLIFEANDWDHRHSLAQRQLSVVVDGETLRLGQMKLVGQSVDTLMTEVLEVQMPHAVFTKIARAQVVEMKVGNSEFELRAQNLAALRDLNNRVKF